MDLDELRARIDECDDQLIRLWLERLDLARQMATLKAQLGLATYDAEREQQMRQRWLQQAGADSQAELLLQACLSASKRQQETLRAGEIEKPTR